MAEPVKATGIVGTHAKAETEGTSLRSKMHGKSSGLRNILIGAVIVAVLIWGGYQIFPTNSASGSTIPLAGRLLIGVMIFLLAGAIAKLLSLLGAGDSKELKSIIRAIAGVILVLFVAFSGVGSWISRSLDWGVNCLDKGDCGPRADDIPTINGGTVFIPQSGEKTFYAIGKVRLNNFIGYCLDVSPKGRFWVTWNEAISIIYIKAKSGKKTKVTVTSRPGGCIQ